MNAQHFDVLIIGACGGGWTSVRPVMWMAEKSHMFTFGYKFRPWQDVKVLADGASIRQYIRHRGGVRHRREDPLRLESRQRRLV